MAGYWSMVFFCMFADQDELQVHKLVKKERSQYPTILTEKAWSIKNLLYGFLARYSRQSQAGEMPPSCPLGQPITVHNCIVSKSNAFGGQTNKTNISTFIQVCKLHHKQYQIAAPPKKTRCNRWQLIGGSGPWGHVSQQSLFHFGYCQNGYSKIWCDTKKGMTHKLGKPLVRLYQDRLVLYIHKLKCLALFLSIHPSHNHFIFLLKTGRLHPTPPS